jgi:hypothetical protein
MTANWMNDRLVEVNLWEYKPGPGGTASPRIWRGRIHVPLCDELRKVVNIVLRRHAMLNPGFACVGTLRDGSVVGRVVDNS